LIVTDVNLEILFNSFAKYIEKITLLENSLNKKKYQQRFIKTRSNLVLIILNDQFFLP